MIAPRNAMPAFVRLIALTFLMCWVRVGAVRAQAPADRFVATLDAQQALTPEARELIRTSWAQCDGCDGAEFLIQGLAVLAPGFRAGLDAYDADEYQRCADIMAELRERSEPFVAVNAAGYEIKALVALDRLADANDRIEKLLADGSPDLDTHSYLAGEIAFLHGYCLLADLQYEEALKALESFLADYPDAGQRLTVSARQMLSELFNRLPGRIGEVVDLMNYSGRRLRHGRSGAPVQEKQQSIIDLLDRLIEEMEDQEQSSSSGGGGGGSGSRSGRQQSPTPMQDSRLPGGSAPEESLRETRRANPAEAWGKMPPAQREQILQALRDSFPGRYRELVEQYYEDLAKRP